MDEKPRDTEKPAGSDALILEAWSQGVMVGALVIMATITISNMRRGVLLHKLIFLELFLGMWHGTFIFPKAPVYGWYLSVTAALLNISWILHNVVSWMKNKPFLSRNVSLFYIGTVALSVPYWGVELYANFCFFNNKNNVYHYTRPYEAVFRDPWWIFTVCNLFYNIVWRYQLGVFELIKVSPRFGVMVSAMLVSVGFVILDIVSVSGALIIDHSPQGVNPFWKFAFIFKCLTDTIILDDFKTALDKLRDYRLHRLSLHRGPPATNGDSVVPQRPMPSVAEPYDESKGVTHSEEKQQTFFNSKDSGDSNAQMVMGTIRSSEPHRFNQDIDIEMQVLVTSDTQSTLVHDDLSRTSGERRKEAWEGQQIHAL